MRHADVYSGQAHLEVSNLHMAEAPAPCIAQLTPRGVIGRAPSPLCSPPLEPCLAATSERCASFCSTLAISVEEMPYSSAISLALQACCLRCIARCLTAIRP